MADDEAEEQIIIPIPKIVLPSSKHDLDPVKEQRKKDFPAKKRKVIAQKKGICQRSLRKSVKKDTPEKKKDLGEKKDTPEKKKDASEKKDTPPKKVKSKKTGVTVKRSRLFCPADRDAAPGTGASVLSVIVPPLEIRHAGKHCLDNERRVPEGVPKPTYNIPRERWQQKIYDQNRVNTAKDFYKYGLIKLPEIVTKKKIDLDMNVPSPEPSSAKVAPKRTTPSPSFLYPPPPDGKDLELRKPKSGIFINEKTGKEEIMDYDSFDLVYSRKGRPPGYDERRRKKKRKRGEGLEDILEADEELGEKPKKKRKKKKKRPQLEEMFEMEALEQNADLLEEFLRLEQEMADMQEGEGEGEESLETYLTKQFRRKVSQISKGTSYQSRDFKEEEEIMVIPPVSRYIQKFRRDSEIKRYEPVRRKIKRGTLESHSLTRIRQETLRDFFFGSKEGSMHQGNENFPESVRNLQGICMPVAAYCYSILKHPNKWSTENIDEILEIGNELMLQSKVSAHMHQEKKDLKPQDLQKYCVIGERKLRFAVEDPEVFGFIRSDDQRVYNLTKALNIFFNRQTAGILTTQEISIAIWKHKYYYMFDARPRTRDLYYSPYGTAMMANFYDIPSLITVFLNRSNFGNWPFVIYPIKVFKVMHKDEEEEQPRAQPDPKHAYNIMNENKAVLHATFDMGDKCFDFNRNKQSLTMATVCLVYSRITPPSAWNRTTLDKIMIIGNQLYQECMECETIFRLTVDSLPAMFTIGPYIVEIYIYANVFGDLLYKKCCCTLLDFFEQFFKTSTNGILQLGKSYLAVWKQRNMFYCFDPYSRDDEGHTCRDGSACVTMHTNLTSLAHTVARNFDDKDAIFYIHALKVCKIQRDPVQSKNFPKHLTMDDFPVENFKQYKMQKSKKTATQKPVTVDYSALAMRKMLAGQDPEASIFEIGSTVESLGVEQIPPMVVKHPSRSLIKKAMKSKTNLIADLDSPSLSDTQIEPPIPQQSQFPEEVEFMDLDSFALTQEEIELQEVALDAEEEYIRKFYAGGDMEGMEEQEGEDEDLDWFYIQNQFTQVREGSLLSPDRSRISEEVNTDITYFPIKKEVLYPTYVRGRQQMKARLALSKSAKDDDWDVFIPAEPEVTQSQELLKESNFTTLPDGTQIVRGTKNVAEFGEDIEFIAPFICVMAGVVSRKYGIVSWSGDIIDYVLKCGAELYKASKLRYDQVSRLEIPKITLGNTYFAVLVEYVFDTYTKQNILEMAIEKILFIRSDIGVMVTPTYACALMYKNHLYYLYDAFGNNEVGLSEGPKNTGTACFTRYKDVHSLVTKIMYNKRKREAREEVIYSRFVLSSVRVKTLHPSQEDTGKKKKKQKKKEEEGEDDGKDEVEAEMTREANATGAEDEIKPLTQKDDGESSEEEIVVMPDGRKRIKKRSAMNKVGYQAKDNFFVLEGTRQLMNRDITSRNLKEDHFVCICACLMLLTTPIYKWDTKKVDQIMENGQHVFSHADDLEVSEKRTIQNVLIGRHFFDIIVKQQKIENWQDRKTFSIAVDTMLKRKLTCFLMQFPNACYVVHRSQDGLLHIFDPYGFPTGKKENKACWVQFKDVRRLKKGLKKILKSGGNAFLFYSFEVTSIKKAPKDVLVSKKLDDYDLLMASRKERLGKPFYEDVEWLKTDPIPWSRMASKAANGHERGKADNMWHNWDIEYNKDLFSLVGRINQNSEGFAEENRGKQTLSSLVVAVGMTEIYNLAEWNSAVVDSILVNGDNYFMECVKEIKEDTYELSMDDLKDTCSIFPFSFKVEFNPVVEGTMFLVRLTQFNLYKGLRYFFNQVDRRSGIICCQSGSRKRQVVFGKLCDSEYYMFDCESTGPPIFLDKSGVAYILRMTTLNRLLHVLTLTLRGGDFFIYDVVVSDLKPIS